MEHNQLIVREKIIAPKDGGKTFAPFSVLEYVDVRTKDKEQQAYVNAIAFPSQTLDDIMRALGNNPSGYLFIRKKDATPIEVITAYNKGGYRRDVAVLNISDLDIKPLTPEQIERVNKVIADTRKAYDNTATAAAPSVTQSSTPVSDTDLPF